MVLKLKSHTVLRPLIFTRPLASRGDVMYTNVCPIVMSNLFLESLQWQTAKILICYT